MVAVRRDRYAHHWARGGVTGDIQKLGPFRSAVLGVRVTTAVNFPTWIPGFVVGVLLSLPLLSLLGVRAQPAGRKPRTDALRNRECILEVAEEAFTHSGANTSLDDIAKHAVVGPGTLYRHFPNRDQLLEAVYRTEVEKLAAAERKFAETMPPVKVLRAWMLLFVDYIASKQIIAPVLNSVVGGHRRYSKHPTVGLGMRFVRWYCGPSRALTYARTSTQSTCFWLSSESLTFNQS
jgi:hypothetical protein